MRPRILIIVTLVLLVGVVLWMARHPVANAAKSWRADSLLKGSEKADRQGDIRDAHRLATAAWQLQPTEWTFLQRLLVQARKLELADLPAITLMAFLHPDGDAASRREILRWTLDRGNTPFFHQLYQSLSQEALAEPAVRVLEAEALAREGRILEAIEAARTLDGIPETETANQASLLLTGLLPLLESNSPAWTQAQDRIYRLLETGEESIRLRAWRNLRLLPSGHRDAGPPFDPVAWIGEQSGATVADRLLARQIELDRQPAAEREGTLDRLIAEFQQDDESLSLLTRWLLETGQRERLLQIPPEAMRADPQLYASRLQALIDIGRLEQAAQWLEQSPPGVSEVMVNSLRAAFASVSGKNTEAVSLWRRVLEPARSMQRYADCFTIHQVAQRFGEEDVIRRVADIIVELPPGKLPRSPFLEYLEPSFADRPEVYLRFWRTLAGNRPDDPFAAEQVAFLEYFLAPDATAEERAEKTGQLLKRYPSVLKFRSTHALWLLKAGRPEEAVAVLREAQVNWNRITDANRAVFALAQWRAGNDREGRLLEQGIRWESISPLRRQLLAALPKKAATPPIPITPAATAAGNLETKSTTSTTSTEP